MQISIDPKLLKILPDLRLGCIVAKKQNILPISDDVWNEIKNLIAENDSMTNECIRQISLIEETKQAYRKLKKDPNRYRPSAEALWRRIVNKKSLYQINSHVDLINYLSLKTGYSIGGYDFTKINQPVKFTLGSKQDNYNGIGKGRLNIENLPILKTQNTAFGSPTSDTTTTMITEDTTEIAIVFYDFMYNDKLTAALDLTKTWLTKINTNSLITEIIAT